ncbi:MAG TPA: condensation domain-containing protein, partial [Gammaproteobacteria bacterium]|nr:condensation domain-containing protein [Gammaproteobacteria bacterium]
MQKPKRGVMVAVMADAKQVQPELISGVWLSLDNTTNSCVVGGEEEAIIEFEEKCHSLGWATIRLKTSHAFHTPMMAEAASEFREKIAAYKLKEPTIPIVSNVSGTWAVNSEIISPQYWAEHILKPVNFSKCLAEVLKIEEGIFVEVGPGHVLSAFAKQHESKKASQQFISVVRNPKEMVDDVEFINRKIGNLWSLGIDVDWYVLKGDLNRGKLSLPTYVFDEDHFPINVRVNGQKSFTQESQSTFASPVDPAIPQLKILDDQIESTVVESYKSVLGFKAIQANQDFFELGGDSLKAISLASAISNLSGIKVEVKDVFKYQTPKKLAEYLGKRSAEVQDRAGIVPVKSGDYYPVSSSQSRMYTLYLLDKNNLAYNLPSATLIKGKLDRDRFENTLKKLVQRHEPLRTNFKMVDNKLVQVIHPNIDVLITYTEKCSETSNIDQLVDDFTKPFDLENEPLFRAELVKTGPESHVFLFDIHHIVADGTSMEVISRDFNQLYFSDLPSLPIQYKDFAVWQGSASGSELLDKQRKFWLGQLSGNLPILK